MSHITTIQAKIDDKEALQEWIQSEEMKNLGFQWIESGKVRYYAGAKHPCDYVIACPGQYDIGVRVNPDGQLSLEADWSYADFYSHLGIARGQKDAQNLIEQRHNEQKFIRHAKKKRWKIKVFDDPNTTARRIEAHA